MPRRLWSRSLVAPNRSKDAEGGGQAPEQRQQGGFARHAGDFCTCEGAKSTKGDTARLLGLPGQEGETVARPVERRAILGREAQKRTGASKTKCGQDAHICGLRVKYKRSNASTKQALI